MSSSSDNASDTNASDTNGAINKSGANKSGANKSGASEPGASIMESAEFLGNMINAEAAAIVLAIDDYLAILGSLEQRFGKNKGLGPFAYPIAAVVLNSFANPDKPHEAARGIKIVMSTQLITNTQPVVNAHSITDKRPYRTKTCGQVIASITAAGGPVLATRATDPSIDLREHDADVIATHIRDIMIAALIKTLAVFENEPSFDWSHPLQRHHDELMQLIKLNGSQSNLDKSYRFVMLPLNEEEHSFMHSRPLSQVPNTTSLPDGWIGYVESRDNDQTMTLKLRTPMAETLVKARANAFAGKPFADLIALPTCQNDVIDELVARLIIARVNVVDETTDKHKANLIVTLQPTRATSAITNRYDLDDDLVIAGLNEVLDMLAPTWEAMA